MNKKLTSKYVKDFPRELGWVSECVCVRERERERVCVRVWSEREILKSIKSIVFLIKINLGKINSNPLSIKKQTR